MKDNLFNLNVLRDAIIYKYKLMGLGEKDLSKLSIDFTSDWSQSFHDEFFEIKKEIDDFNHVYATDKTKIKPGNFTMLHVWLMQLRNSLASIVESMSKLNLNGRNFHTVKPIEYDLVEFDQTPMTYKVFGFDYFDFLMDFQRNLIQIMASNMQDLDREVSKSTNDCAWYYMDLGYGLEILIDECRILNDFMLLDDEYKMSYMLFRIRNRCFYLARTLTYIMEEENECFFIVAKREDEEVGMESNNDND